MRRTLRNRIIATVGHTPMALYEIVRLCGPKCSPVERKFRVLGELRRLQARGFIARIGGKRFVASDRWVDRERRA